MSSEIAPRQLPARTALTNFFPFSTRVFSISNSAPLDSPTSFDFHSSIFVFRPNSFIYRFYAESPTSPFISRIYETHPGVAIPTFRLSDVQTCRPLCLCVSVANPLLSYPCDLFAPFFAPLPFVFNRLQPLFPKHPGWGYPLPPDAAQRHLRALLN
jgi:hypothetical protein